MTDPSAVAIIETPDAFIVEGRPERPGELAHAGKLQLFGGSVNPDEEPGEAIARELAEELNLHGAHPQPVWSGEVDSQDKAGNPVTRKVHLFRVTIRSAMELTLQVPGEIVEVPQTLEAIEAHKSKFTPFALRALTKAITGEPWE